MVKMLGFVGCGNMAQAMLKGILSKGLYAKEDILVSRRNEVWCKCYDRQCRSGEKSRYFDSCGVTISI